MSTALEKETAPSTITAGMPQPLSIFEEMERMMKKIEDRAFSLFKERGSVGGSPLEDWFRAESELVKTAPVEVEEQDHEIVVRAEVPGFEVKELSVKVEPYDLCIYGKSEKKTETNKKEKHYYSEISSSEVCRHISLPAAVDPDKASASLDKGVLEVKLPKAAPAKLIDVKKAA